VAEKFDVIIIGGGAAGLMCAITAGQRGRRVLVLEASERIGKKIEISGGGRCNFTNLGATPENFLSANPDFCRSALARYTPWDFVALVEKHGIAYHEKTLGQQFCDGSSRQIVEMLLAECAAANVTVRCGVRVETVEKIDGFRLTTNGGVCESAALVVATGGLSFPKLGATDFGHRLARQFGLRLTPLRPALVPLTFSRADEPLHALSGVALPVTVRCGEKGRDGCPQPSADRWGQRSLPAFREAMLVTHRGLSGPAILQISSYWREGQMIEIDLLPGVDPGPLLLAAKAARRELIPLLAEHWPRRFAEAWCAHEVRLKPPAQCKDTDLAALAQRLRAWPFEPVGTEGYAKAEVTLGGVDTTELSSKTLESRRVPGLFFIGEVVDVTGWLGGYNFQWAWASGHAAGEAV
jgi:predicted Rossmann fold flavoprotein